MFFASSPNMILRVALILGIGLMGCGGMEGNSGRHADVFSTQLRQKIEQDLGDTRAQRLMASAERRVLNDQELDRGLLVSLDAAASPSTLPVTSNLRTLLTLDRVRNEVVDFQFIGEFSAKDEAFDEAIEVLERPVRPIAIEPTSVVGVAEVVYAEIQNEFKDFAWVSRIEVSRDQCLQGECRDFVLLVSGGFDGEKTQVVDGKLWPWSGEKLGFVFPTDAEGTLSQTPEIFRLKDGHERHAFEISLESAALEGALPEE